MRKSAIEFAATGQAALRDLGEPPPLQTSDVLIETLYTGITNGTERHALLTEHGFGGGRFPSRHGYQHVGKVAAVGESVTRFSVGDAVYYGAYCGHNGWNVANENGLLLKLPDGADLHHFALFGVAGVALRSVRRMGVRAGDNVLVAGQGPIGNFTAQSARAVGAKVTVLDLLDKRLDVARACGVHVVLNGADAETPSRLKAGGPYNFIYDCCSAKDLLFDLHRDGLLAHGGTVGMMAVRETVTYPWSLLHIIEARLETSCHFNTDDLRTLLFLYEQGLVQVEPLISHSVPIEDAPRMYDLLANRSEELLGVVFDWTDSTRS